MFGMSGPELVVVLLVLLGFAALYLLPSYVARKRSHPQFGAIVLVNSSSVGRC